MVIGDGVAVQAPCLGASETLRSILQYLGRLARALGGGVAGCSGTTPATLERRCGWLLADYPPYPWTAVWLVALGLRPL